LAAATGPQCWEPERGRRAERWVWRKSGVPLIRELAASWRDSVFDFEERKRPLPREEKGREKRDDEAEAEELEWPVPDWREWM
jgi:hypothetical protein